MRQWMRRAAAGLLAAAALAGAASAANFTHCADALKDMGLFIGTRNGYELDRVPTRAEAAVMLVRLLGQEDAAQHSDFATPFTDVPAWAAPYVGWLYENELTVGVSGTRFGTTLDCSAQQYATFLLRALGYADGDAYTYEGALDFAREQGVIDAVNCDTENFLRDHVVAMSYTALSRPTKDGTGTLLDTLILRGSVNREQASDTLTLFQSHQAYERAKAQTNLTNPRTYELTATITDNAYNTASYRGTATIDGDDLSAELRQGDALIMGLYQADGTCYQYVGGHTVQADTPIDLDGGAQIPISAVMGLTAQDGRYAFSFVPAVLGEMVTTPGASVSQVDYSARTQGGLLGQQIGRIHIALPVDGRTVTYEIELTATLADRAEQVSPPDGMEV